MSLTFTDTSPVTDTDLTFTDIFCGAGGSSIGLASAGLKLKFAANHWGRAIETHSTNFPDAEHDCADVSNYDWRRIPRTDIAWFSPECTWHSPAGGRKRVRKQLDLLDDYVPDDGGVRSRATAYDVLRAAEVHRYKAIIVENVCEFAAWESYDQWMSWLRSLGYNVQIVCVSAAHIGDETNPHAPQWRDRYYAVATLKGIPLPDVRPRPLAWCFDCDEQVNAVQAWKETKGRRKSELPARVGKYGQQYVYRCPNVRCRNAVVEPYVLPAAAAIDWTDLGTRIGDRTKPLAPATMRRIEAGLRMFAQPTVLAAHGQTWERPGSGYVRAWPTDDAPLNARTGTPADGVATPPYMVTVNHDDHGRCYPAGGAPLPPRTTKIGDGVIVPPMLVPAGGTWNDDARPVDEPMRTRTTRDTEGVLVPPFMVHGYSGGVERRVKGIVDAPLQTIVANGRGHHGMCVPAPFLAMLRGQNRPMGADEPLAAVTTGRNHGLTVPPGAFYTKHFTQRGSQDHLSKDVRADPLGAITGADHHSLVIPFRRGNRARTTGEPLHTLSTRDSAALVQPAIDVDDCHFRMLQPREHLRAQRFPDGYRVLGNKSEQTMQAGNAVPSNVAQWLAGRVIAVLDRTAAAA